MRATFGALTVATTLLLAGCGGSSPATADSAVAFSPDAQNYGYCFDTPDANLCAEKYCYEGNQSRPCQTLFRSAALGHFSLALGNQGWGVGYSKDSDKEAGDSAMAQCWQQTQGCRVVETWVAKGMDN